MRLVLVTLVIAFSVSASFYAHASDLEFFGQSFDHVTSVAEGVDLIRATLENQGFEIIATIDHQAGASSVDLDLRPTQVILFSRPRLDRVLIRRSQVAAIDLPHKFLVFEDENSRVQLRYNPPGFVIDRHNTRVNDRLVATLDRALSQFGRLDNGVTFVKSRQSVEQTIERLLTILREREFRIPAVIDFTEQTHKFAEKLRDTQLIIFGNPNVGTPLMQNTQEIGLDLPQKFLVFENRAGEVLIAFNDPRFLGKKHSLQSDRDPADLDTRLTNIANALLGLAEAGAQP